MSIPGSTFTKEGLDLRRWEKIIDDSYINVLDFMRNSEYRFPTLSYVMKRRLTAGEQCKAWWDYPFFVSLGAILTEEHIAFDPYCSVLRKFMDSPQFAILCQADPVHTQIDFKERFDEMFKAKQQPLASKNDFNRLKKYPLNEFKKSLIERPKGYSLDSLLDSPWRELVDDEQHLLQRYAETTLQRKQKIFQENTAIMSLELSRAYIDQPVNYALCSLESEIRGSNLIMQVIDSHYLRTYGGSVLLTRLPRWWEYVLWG